MAAELPGYLTTALAALRGRLAAAARPRAVGGVCPGARAVALTALADGDEPFVVVVPTAREGEELLAGLALVAPEIPAVLLPAEAVDGALGRSPALGSTAAAATALARFASGEARLLVVPARALPFPLPSPAALAPATLRLTPGDPIDTIELGNRLIAVGYRRVEVVEEAGDFALRGLVVDIGMVERCVRLLLDADVIESIAELDPSTQRSGASLELAEIPPLRLFSASSSARVALAAQLESAGYTRLAELALDAVQPELWEGLLGWAQPSSRAWQLAEHVAVVEPTAVRAEIDRVFVALEHAREAIEREGTPLPPASLWLPSAEQCGAALVHADRVDELIIEDSTPWTRIRTAPTESFASRLTALTVTLRDGALARQSQVLLGASHGEEQRLAHLLADAELPLRHDWPEPGAIGIVRGELPHGFSWLDAELTIYGRADLTTLPRPSRQRRSLARVLAEMRDLAPGDFVVHTDHGIGRFVGFRQLALDGESHECVELEYAGAGKLLVPLERADVLEKYAASEGNPPKLDRLGGSSWARTKSRVKRALRDMAEELLKVQAQRELAAGFGYSKDSPWQREFEDAFEFELTADQSSAVGEVKRDMESPRPMDRLLVGDVGYGKTEVAMRAAFKVVMDGKQVVALAPTTILAEQHYRTFTRRFAGFPVEIRWLSRFVPAPEQKKVVAGLADGTADVVIGTHRLLAGDVRPRDLGLVIVDEEQRFGVAQKEKLKALKSSVDVLSLSATPIPRTLNLGLLGLRDVSVIETPPRDRLAVQTHVLPFRREVVREAILNEIGRGGQVFFVHNRIASIGAIATLVRETVPEARVVVAHGKMEERSLEKAMDSFVEGRADVLLSTSIIENGLDIPNANTLIVNRADRFGLAQLYQLRGRVGRSDRLAFAYLLVPPERSLSQEARARLAAILEFSDLGAGFRIAARDLEIRGAGNILGAEQHGHLRAVGYETYCQLLEEAVRELRGEEAPPPTTTVELRLGLDLRLPDGYVAEETLRLALYRRVAGARADEELEAVRAELVDRFGPPPPQLDYLCLHQRVRRRAEALGITKLRRSGIVYELHFDPTHPASHATALALVASTPGAGLSPTGVVRLPGLPRDPYEGAKTLVERLPR
jgi:transcription-repair coupling factor (superfamily II helicase)